MFLMEEWVTVNRIGNLTYRITVQMLVVALYAVMVQDCWDRQELILGVA
jgi:hypothetical protein